MLLIVYLIATSIVIGAAFAALTNKKFAKEAGITTFTDFVMLIGCSFIPLINILIVGCVIMSLFDFDDKIHKD